MLRFNRRRRALMPYNKVRSEIVRTVFRLAVAVEDRIAAGGRFSIFASMNAAPLPRAGAASANPAGKGRTIAKGQVVAKLRS